MILFAHVNQNSVRDYRNVVVEIQKYDSDLKSALPVFDDVLESLSVKMQQLVESVQQLKDAQILIKDKIEECEKKIDEIESQIDSLENEIESTKAQLSSADETVAASLLRVDLISLQESLVEKKSELHMIHHRLVHCKSLRSDLRKMISQINVRMNVLSESKTKLLKNRDAYIENQKRSLELSEKANKSLLKVEHAISEYKKKQVKTLPASNSIGTIVMAKGISNIAYISKRFQKIQMEQEKLQTEAYQKKKLVNAGVSPGIVDKIRLRDDGVYEVESQNCDLEGKKHPETRVPYVRKTVRVKEISLSVVVPVFEPVFETTLSDNMLMESDSVQFAECLRQLAQEMQRNPSLRTLFSDRETEMINDGIKPGNYTWHHNEETGKMQLVNREIHFKTNHTGGRALWGGGNR